MNGEKPMVWNCTSFGKLNTICYLLVPRADPSQQKKHLAKQKGANLFILQWELC